jgi:hypothetical protein
VTKSSQGRARRRAERKSTPSPKFRVEASAKRLLATTPGPQLEIPIEDLGYPGWLNELHVVPQFDDGEIDDHRLLTNTVEREFEVAALLSKAPTITSSLNFQFSAADGSSHFLIPAYGLEIVTPWGHVRVSKNAGGEASLIEMKCVDRSPGEASKRLQLACSTFLDHWAFEATAPVYLTRIRVWDVQNQVESIQFTSPFRQSTINPAETELPLPLRPMFALYREALCSASPLYRFLCLYKILEGYFGRLKPSLAKLFGGAGLSYPPPKDIVPDHPELDDRAKAYVGQSISKFRDEQLMPNFRTAVAHFEKEGDDPLIASDPGELIRFNQMGLAVELCARAVIESYKRAFVAAIAAGLDVASLM